MSVISRIGTVVAAADPTREPWTSHDTLVLIVAAIGIALVVVLIIWLKLHAFLALTIAALLVGLGSGIGLEKVSASYQAGVGGVLGYVGVLIALGAMLGKLLADSGGADKVVDTLLRGRPATLPWKMALIAGIIGIPMFFEIGLVLLIPVVMLAVRRSKGLAMRLGIPALAGLSVLHGFVPPHPGPLAAIGILKANVGITLAIGLLIAIPTVIVAGPLFGRLAARWVPVSAAGAALAVTGGGYATDSTTTPARGSTGGSTGTTGGGTAGVGGTAVSDGAPVAETRAQDPDATRSPSFAWTLVTILSPLVLMLFKAAADIWMATDSPLRGVLDFIGDPVVALLVAVLLAMVTFGTTVGFSASVLTKKIGQSLLPIVGVMLIVGAGGGFKQVLVDGGTGCDRKDRRRCKSLGAGPRLDRCCAHPPGDGVGDSRNGDGSRNRRTGRDRSVVTAIVTRRSCRWCGISVLLAPQRRGVLAGQRVLRPDHRPDHQVVVGDGDNHLRDGPRLDASAFARVVAPQFAAP
ncbi:MAG: gluconate:H+ symporter, GntP family [Microbacteriaceae bacterium]|jgi:GntP family gluconate:H+ symporter|nr:gluconate:H+ symporter, GntP family [Microbacteriaceae bacterium]